MFLINITSYLVCFLNLVNELSFVFFVSELEKEEAEQKNIVIQSGAGKS
jgi:hypothetical protein